jgi:hypothetical protein
MHVSSLCRFKLNARGQSIVEVALITPLVLIALYVPADFGIAFLTAHLTQNAVREAARIGSTQKPPFNNSLIQSEAVARMPDRLRSKTATATLLTAGSANCAQVVRVIGQGTYDYAFYRLMNLFGFDHGNTPMVISRAAYMRYEFQPVTNHEACTA